MAVSWPYRGRIVAVSRPFIGRIEAVLWPYRGRIEAIYLMYPFAKFGISSIKTKLLK